MDVVDVVDVDVVDVSRLTTSFLYCWPGYGYCVMSSLRSGGFQCLIREARLTCGTHSKTKTGRGMYLVEFWSAHS